MRRMPSLWVLPALVVLVGLLAGLAACGDDEEEGPTATPTQATATPTQATATPQVGLEGLQPGESLKIGVVLTTSGPIGKTGQDQLTGLELGVDEINAAGGVAGHPIDLVIRDDGGDPTRALSLAQELVEGQGVKFIVGTTLSSPALAINSYLAEQKVPNIGSFAADNASNPEEFPYSFTGSPVASAIGKVQVNLALDLLKPSKVGIIAESTAFGDAALAGYQAALEERGITDVAVERNEQGAPDVSAQLLALKDAGVDVLFVGSGGLGDIIRIFRTRNSLGWDVALVSTSEMLTTDVLNGVGGPDQAKNAYGYLQIKLTYPPGGQPSAEAVAWVDKLRESTGNPEISVLQPTLFRDIAYMIKAALEQAGSVDGDAIKAALESLQFSGLQADMDYTPQRHYAITEDDLAMGSVEKFDGAFAERLGE